MRLVIALTLGLLGCDRAAAGMPRDAGLHRHTCDPAAVCPPRGSASEGVVPAALRELLQLAEQQPDANIDLGRANALLAQLWNPMLVASGIVSNLDALGRQLDASLPGRCDDTCRLAHLLTFVYQTLGLHAEIDPSGAYRDIRRDLIPYVLEEHTGYCEGLAYLMIALGDRIGLRLSVVSERQHVDVRYDGPAGARTMDPTIEGAPPVGSSNEHCDAAPGVYGVALRRSETIGLMLSSLAGRAGRIRGGWLDSSVRLVPASPQALNNRGVEREMRMDLEAALEDFRAAAHLDPCVAYPVANEARVLAQIGRRSEALSAIARLDALAGADDNPSAHLVVALARGDERIEADDDATADRFYLRALSIAPGTTIAAVHLARAREAQGRDREAASAWASAIQTSDEPGYALSRIEALALSGDIETAAIELDRFEHDHPASAGRSLARALVAFALGRDEDARLSARACLAQWGMGCARALLVLGDIARRGHDGRCAEAYTQSFLACDWPAVSRSVRRWQSEARARLGHH